MPNPSPTILDDLAVRLEAEKEADRDLAKRAKTFCNLEQQIRNEGHFPVRQCPRRGCFACRESAIWQQVTEETCAEIAAVFGKRPRPLVRALQQQGADHAR